jgi:hypothetical protein
MKMNILSDLRGDRGQGIIWIHLLGFSNPVGCLCGCSSVGRASASQAEGREFEPRRPLQF